MESNHKYCIRVYGILDKKWADWFNGLSIHPGEFNETQLVGTIPDQAALHGILAKIRDLGLTLLSVQMLSQKEEMEKNEYN